MRRMAAVGPTLLFLLTLFVAGPCGTAQTITLHARTNLVLVPTLVESHSGEPVFGLTVKDFAVTDNGVPQKIRLDTETDDAPMSIVVLVQVGRAAAAEFDKLRGLPTMVDALAGNTDHRIAVVAFDSRPQMLQDFTGNPDAVQQALSSIRPGDGGAAILDAVWYAVDMLQDEPPRNQRVIVLVSETRDHGSKTPIKEVVRRVGQSDVIVYSLAFSPARTEFLHDLKYGGGSGLLGALIMASNAIRKNTAAAIPYMTGGQYLRFNQGKQLDSEMEMLANQVHNRYILSFSPSDPKPGLHFLHVQLLRNLDATTLARATYWAAGPSKAGEEAIPGSKDP